MVTSLPTRSGRSLYVFFFAGSFLRQSSGLGLDNLAASFLDFYLSGTGNLIDLNAKRLSQVRHHPEA